MQVGSKPIIRHSLGKPKKDGGQAGKAGKEERRRRASRPQSTASRRQSGAEGRGGGRGRGGGEGKGREGEGKRERRKGKKGGGGGEEGGGREDPAQRPGKGAAASASVAAKAEAAWPAPGTMRACRRMIALAFSLCKMMESRWRRVVALCSLDVSSPVAKACFLASSDQTQRACLPHPPPEASKIMGMNVNPDCWHIVRVDL